MDVFATLFFHNSWASCVQQWPVIQLLSCVGWTSNGVNTVFDSLFSTPHIFLPSHALPNFLSMDTCIQRSAQIQLPLPGGLMHCSKPLPNILHNIKVTKLSHIKKKQHTTLKSLKYLKNRATYYLTNLV